MKGTLAALSMLSMAAVATPASAASLIGDTVTCTRNGVACSGTSQATITANAVEFDRGSSTYDFGPQGLTSTFSSGVFVNPLVYSFADTTKAFTSFSNLTFSGLTGFSANNVTLTNGSLAINLSGVEAAVGSTLSLTLSTAATGAVPEPATWALMILGMGAVGFAMRRQKKNVSTTVRFA